MRLVLHHVFGQTTSSLTGDPADVARMADLVGHVPMPGTLDELRRSERLHFVKTHRPPDADAREPVLYVVRDGRDALVSYAHYILDFGGRYSGRLERWRRRGRRAVRTLFTGRSPYEHVLRGLVETDEYRVWGDRVLAWLDAAETRPVAMIRFEELVADPAETVSRALAAIEVHLPARGDGIPDFAQLRTADERFFRQGRVGAWCEVMSEELHRSFWRRHGAAMDRLGYTDGKPG